jgi:hypothetical protein
MASVNTVRPGKIYSKPHKNAVTKTLGSAAGIHSPFGDVPGLILVQHTDNPD